MTAIQANDALTAVGVKSVLMGLKKGFDKEPSSQLVFRVLRMIAKFEKIQSNSTGPQISAVMAEMLDCHKEMLTLAQDRYENKALRQACEFLLDLPLAQFFTNAELPIKQQEQTVKGVVFTAQPVLAAESYTVLFDAKSNTGYIAEVVKKVNKSQSSVSYSVPQTVREFADIQAQIKEDFDNYAAKISQAMSRHKKQIEAKILALGISDQDLQFVKSFW